MHDNPRTFSAVKANPPKPGDGGSRGGKSGQDNSTAIAPTNIAGIHTARAGERLLSVLLDRVAGWLIAYAYGGYAKTVSAAAVALADRMALAAYCQCLVPLPVEFTAPCDDVPSARLLDAFGLLAVGSMSSVRLGDGRLAVCSRRDRRARPRDGGHGRVAAVPVVGYRKPVHGRAASPGHHRGRRRAPPFHPLQWRNPARGGVQRGEHSRRPVA